MGPILVILRSNSRYIFVTNYLLTQKVNTIFYESLHERAAHAPPHCYSSYRVEITSKYYPCINSTTSRFRLAAFFSIYLWLMGALIPFYVTKHYLLLLWNALAVQLPVPLTKQYDHDHLLHFETLEFSGTSNIQIWFIQLRQTKFQAHYCFSG